MSGLGEVLAGITKVSAVIGAIVTVGALLSMLGWFTTGMQTAATGEIPIEALSALILIAAFASLPWWLPTN